MPSEGPRPSSEDLERSGEARRLTRLFRVMALFILWPAATAALALVLFQREHGAGMTAYFVLGTAAGALLFAAAPSLGRRFA